jgi:molybdopterin synthase sulfur carrier subunit
VAEVWVPALLRDLTGGQERVSAAGETVRQVIDALEERYPGMRERLCEDGRLRGNIALVVDGAVSRQRLRQKLRADSEVHFVPAIGGG